MSIGKLSDAGHLGEQFKGMTIEQFKEEAEKTFWQTYGRYENASGKMYCELEHNGDADHTKGSVKWRKGITDGEVLEDEILERPQAIVKFFRMVDKGYSLAFAAITESDFEREREKLRLAQSAIKREGLLGIYVRGEKEFFRVNEYEGKYSVERGYDEMITKGIHELTEEEARIELDFALGEGFTREGEQNEIECANPFAAWGVSNEEAKASNIELQNQKPKEGEFDMSAFAGMFGDDN